MDVEKKKQIQENHVAGFSALPLWDSEWSHMNGPWTLTRIDGIHDARKKEDVIQRVKQCIQDWIDTNHMDPEPEEETVKHTFTFHGFSVPSCQLFRISIRLYQEGSNRMILEWHHRYGDRFETHQLFHEWYHVLCHALSETYTLPQLVPTCFQSFQTYVVPTKISDWKQYFLDCCSMSTNPERMYRALYFFTLEETLLPPGLYEYMAQWNPELDHWRSPHLVSIPSILDVLTHIIGNDKHGSTVRYRQIRHLAQRILGRILGRLQIPLGTTSRRDRRRERKEECLRLEQEWTFFLGQKGKKINNKKEK